MNISVAKRCLKFYIARMAEPYQCLVCGQTEQKCDCTRYCSICQGYDDVRLVEDGQYYCQACREACDYRAQY